MRPPYVMVIPDEAEQYGSTAAMVLAHIRFRCSKDGSDRFERDGYRWWRVSHLDLGREIGASRKSVMKALQHLGGAVVSANNVDDPRDQTRAYRPAVDIVPLTSQSPDWDRSDSSETQSGQDRSQTGQVPVPNGTGTGPDRDSALPSGELKEEEQEPPSPPSAEASPTHAEPASEEREQQNGLPDPEVWTPGPEERGQERGRSDPVAVSASRLVSTLVPATFPAAFKTALRIQASTLIVGDQLPTDVVAESIRRLLDRPGAGPGLLPYIAADVLREGTTPDRPGKIESWANLTDRLADAEQRKGTAPAPRSKLRDWHEFVESIPDAREPEQEPATPLAIEAKAVPGRPQPVQPESVRGPNGEPRCRRHAHLPHRPPSCQACTRLSDDDAGEAS